MVTSAQHGEGKSTAVANLGVSLALDGNRVLVLDCDLRHHNLHEFFDVRNEPGLSSILTGQATIEECVAAIPPQRLSAVLPMRAAIGDSIGGPPALSVMPSGPTPLSPTDLLASGRATRVFRDLREQYDYVLVDAPPVLPVSDVAVLTKHVDGVVFLANDVVSRRGAIRRAVRLLTQVDAPVIGMIVNATPAHQLDGYGDYGGYSGYGGYWGEEGVEGKNGSKRSGSPTADRPRTVARGADARDR
jgi:capsular exopolysaccharide synthesis family protein